MIRAFVSLLTVLAVAETATAQQYRRGFAPAPVLQPVLQPPLFRPAVFPIVPITPVVPIIPPPSTAFGRTVDPFTGTVTQFGSAFDPFSGTVQQSTASFNPQTGTTRTQDTLVDPFTGATVQRRTAGNPITGQYISTYRSQRPQFLPMVPVGSPFAPRMPLFR